MGAILLANLDETISNVYFEYELEWRLAWEIFIGLPLWKTILIPLDLLGFKWKILIFFFSNISFSGNIDTKIDTDDSKVNNDKRLSTSPNNKPKQCCFEASWELGDP